MMREAAEIFFCRMEQIQPNSNDSKYDWETRYRDIQTCGIFFCSNFFPLSSSEDDPNYWETYAASELGSGILQARILEWVAIPFSRRSSQPRV